MPSKQAEAITAAITEVLNDSLENVSESLVSKVEMQRVRSFRCLTTIFLFYCPFVKFATSFVIQDTHFIFYVLTAVVLVPVCVLKTEMLQESNLSKFKAEVQSSQVFVIINQAELLHVESVFIIMI